MSVATWIFEPEEREIIGKDIIKLKEEVCDTSR